jgi:hypothetical protein
MAPWAALSVLVATVAAAAMGCGSPGSDTDPADASPGDQSVQLGTGEAEFEPIDGEPHLRLVAGVQGGFHAWASFLAYGFDSSRLDMVLETLVEDDPATRLVMRARLSLRDGLDAEGEPTRFFAGFPAQVYDARCAHGKRVRVAVTLADASGASASDERHYIAELDAAQRRDDCASSPVER